MNSLASIDYEYWPPLYYLLLKKKVMKKIMLSVFAVCISSLLFAQTNFSGSWKEPNLEMIDGIQYANAMPKQMDVVQTKDSIKITSFENAENATPFTQSFALKGKASSRVGKTSKRTITTSATWSADKKTLTFVTIYSYAEKPTEAEYTNTEVWALNENGQLIITKTSDAAVTDDWTIKATYSK